MGDFELSAAAVTATGPLSSPPRWPAAESSAVVCRSTFRVYEELNRWSFLCVVAPLRLCAATGSPVNPIAIF